MKKLLAWFTPCSPGVAIIDQPRGGGQLSVLRTGGMQISISMQGLVGAALSLALVYLFCRTWESSKERRSSREAAIRVQTDGDDAGGGRRTSASREYHREGKRSGGQIKAGTVAAMAMSEAATASVRQLQKMQGGYVKKGSLAAKLASSEATRLRTFEASIPSP